jgi:nucleotide-binding universal stress UspA family protein
MIRSILLAIDTSPASVAAEAFGIQLSLQMAQRSDGSRPALALSAVAVVDRPTIVKPQASPIGGSAYKVQRDAEMLADAQQKVHEILDAFEHRCRTAGVPYHTIRSEGLPEEQIEKASRSHDLILIGRDTDFHFETHGHVGETVQRLLKINPRPVLVVPDGTPPGRNVVLAYDGSVKASHAVHMWALLNLRAADAEVHVVSVAREAAAARSMCGEVSDLMARHDISVRAHAVESAEEVIEALREVIPPLEPQFVVIGAFGNRGLRARLFGSTTDAMVETCPYPLLIIQ